mmetsp:Transcript_5662/g.21345  ORF Transcript_5662/g.21345 Transcript_5662/m.21345 type:complete len:344 (+) Transcript_5662:492-1523(+)
MSSSSARLRSESPKRRWFASSATKPATCCLRSARAASRLSCSAPVRASAYVSASMRIASFSRCWCTTKSWNSSVVYSSAPSLRPNLVRKSTNLSSMPASIVFMLATFSSRSRLICSFTLCSTSSKMAARSAAPASSSAWMDSTSTACRHWADSTSARSSSCRSLTPSMSSRMRSSCRCNRATSASVFCARGSKPTPPFSGSSPKTALESFSWLALSLASCASTISRISAAVSVTYSAWTLSHSVLSACDTAATVMSSCMFSNAATMSSVKRAKSTSSLDCLAISFWIMFISMSTFWSVALMRFARETSTLRIVCLVSVCASLMCRSSSARWCIRDLISVLSVA